LCLSYHRSFGKPKKQSLRFSDFIKFYDFVLNRLNKVALSEKTNISRTSLWRRFKPFFRYSPTSFDSLFLLRSEAPRAYARDIFLSRVSPWSETLYRMPFIPALTNGHSGTWVKLQNLLLENDKIKEEFVINYLKIKKEGFFRLDFT
jgi:hypothetical protein